MLACSAGNPFALEMGFAGPSSLALSCRLKLQALVRGRVDGQV